METTKQQYLNTSFIICGAVCLLRVFAHYVFKYSVWNESTIPGLSALLALSYPLLYAWVGLLLRKISSPKWWTQVLIMVLLAYCLYRYCDWNAHHWYAIHLHLAMMGLGYLIPPRELALESRKKGWIGLAMSLLSIFCFTAVVITKQRLLWGALMPEHQDMERLLEALMRITEPLLCILSAYLVIGFSFSGIAQKLGELKWVRILVKAACVLSFIYALLFFLMHLTCWSVMMSRVNYNPFLLLAVQPVSVYLLVALYRRWQNRKTIGK